MADDLNDDLTPDAGAEPPQHTESDIEQRAREQGWVPKEEWTGEGKWRDAESFLDRGELFAKIDSQRRKLRELEDNQKAFTSHLETVRKSEFNRAMKQLLAQKKDALEGGNADAVISTDEEIAALRAAAIKAEYQAQAQPQSQEPHPEFVAWTNRNQWYNTSLPMKAFAEAVAVELQSAGERDPARILKEVETRVRKEFPHKFTNPNRERPGAVEGGANKANAAAKADYPLSPEEKKTMDKLVRMGVMTKEQYIADIKAATERGKK